MWAKLKTILALVFLQEDMPVDIFNRGLGSVISSESVVMGRTHISIAEGAFSKTRCVLFAGDVKRGSLRNRVDWSSAVYFHPTLIQQP